MYKTYFSPHPVTSLPTRNSNLAPFDVTPDTQPRISKHTTFVPPSRSSSIPTRNEVPYEMGSGWPASEAYNQKIHEPIVDRPHLGTYSQHSLARALSNDIQGIERYTSPVNSISSSCEQVYSSATHPHIPAYAQHVPYHNASHPARSSSLKQETPISSSVTFTPHAQAHVFDPFVYATSQSKQHHCNTTPPPVFSDTRMKNGVHSNMFDYTPPFSATHTGSEDIGYTYTYKSQIVGGHAATNEIGGAAGMIFAGAREEKYESYEGSVVKKGPDSHAESWGVADEGMKVESYDQHLGGQGSAYWHSTGGHAGLQHRDSLHIEAKQKNEGIEWADRNEDLHDLDFASCSLSRRHTYNTTSSGYPTTVEGYGPSTRSDSCLPPSTPEFRSTATQGEHTGVWQSLPQTGSSTAKPSLPPGHRGRMCLPTSIPAPVPVPNVTKPSRGRRVPTAESLGDPAVQTASGITTSGEGQGGGARTHMCNVEGCGKVFARGEHLRRHIRGIHTYEKPHKCPYLGCGKDFSRADNLNQHMRVHGVHYEDHVPFQITTPRLL